MGAIPATIGPYDVESEIGRGGMGVVYAARDASLDRLVAIKVLPKRLANQGMARFRREAKLLATIQHPNIAAVYGFEQDGDEAYLVLEYVEGRGLDEVLRSRRMTVEESLAVGLQIAEAIEAAHAQGVIHRDLKPGNIRITPEGRVKVLDFGLAKALVDDDEAADLEDSLTAVATIPGVVLGTAGYMSPEQARGRNVDKRTDIWSFGCLLYECLVGRKVFAADTVSDSIADVLHIDPDWEPLPPDTPPTIQLLLRRCLAKDRDQRLHDIADARLEIQEVLADPGASTLSIPSRLTLRRKRTVSPAVMVAAALGVLLGALGGFAALRRFRPAPTAPPPTVRFTFDLPPEERLGTNDRLMNELAISPDGRSAVFLVERDGGTRLLLRRIDEHEASVIPQTEDARGPFFSPDGQWIGFLAGFETLMKVSLRGGPPETICPAPEPSGCAAWLPGGWIVFTARHGTGLMVVSDAGGEPRLLADVDRDAGVMRFENVQPRLDGRGVLAGVLTGDSIEDYRVVSVDLEDGAIRAVVENAAHPMPIATGHIAFLRDSSLVAVPFDHGKMTARGPVVPVLNGVAADNRGGSAQYAVSPNGTLLYVPGQRRGRERGIISVSESGVTEMISDGTDAFYDDIRASPDGDRVAVLTLRRGSELWSYDRTRRTLTLLNGVGDSVAPVWSPDGREVAFRRVLRDRDEVLIAPADGGRDPEALPLGPGVHVPTSWSSKDQTLLLTRAHNEPGDQNDIVVHRRDGAPGVEPFLATPDNEGEARFSPNGRWIAYRSDKTGRFEVYVRAYPDDGRAYRISTAGGYSPTWSPAGDRIHFVNGNALWAVPITETPVFREGQPTKLFDSPTFAEINDAYSVDPRGGFVMIELAEWERTPGRVHAVLGWGEELRRQVPGS